MNATSQQPRPDDLSRPICSIQQLWSFDRKKPEPKAWSWVHLLAGGAGTIASCTLTAPLDVVKTRFQSDFYQTQLAQSRAAKGLSLHPHLSPLRSGLLHLRETCQIIGSVHKLEGWRALFRGLGPILVATVPTKSISFFMTGNGIKMIADYGNNGQKTPGVVACAAVLGGITTSTVTNPIWVVKTRLQLDKNMAEKSGGMAYGARRYQNSRDCVRQLVRQEGVRSLYKGLATSYLGSGEHAITWVLYEQIKKAAERRKERVAMSGRQRTFWDELIDSTVIPSASGSAKAVATIIAYPHEVVRTRLRQAPTVDGHLKYTGLLQCFKLVWKQEGVAALYGGLTPHFLRTVPSSIIQFTIYEAILKLSHVRY